MVRFHRPGCTHHIISDNNIMSAGARVIDPMQFGRGASDAIKPGLVGPCAPGPFSNPLMQHCPGAISAPQLLQPKAPLDESSRDASEGSGTHVLADSPSPGDDAGVEQQQQPKARDGWTGRADDVEDITRMLLQDGGSMMDATGALTDYVWVGYEHYSVHRGS